MSPLLFRFVRALSTLPHPRTLAHPKPREKNILLLVGFLSLLFYALLYLHAFAIDGPPQPLGAWTKLQSVLPWTTERIEHPIPGLIQEAKTKFETMMRRQSKSLSEAAQEYRRRYGRDPPRGFDEWYAFAVSNKVRIIDEYDGMDADLQPFRHMTGQEFRSRVTQALKLPNVHKLTLSGGRISTGEHDFNKYITRFASKLPDMSMAINDHDEPKVLVPWEYMNKDVKDDEDLENMSKATFKEAWEKEGNTWDAFRQTCHPSSPARQLSAGGLAFSGAVDSDQIDSALLKGDPKLIGFKKRPDDDLDFCEHPSGHFWHGLFYSRWRTIPALLPLLSPGKPQRYSDILIPSNYYINGWGQYTYGDDHEGVISDFDRNEKPWHQKESMMYWRGATTGGSNLFPGSFYQFQRQRFVQMTFRESPSNHTVLFPSTPSRSEYALRKIQGSQLNLETVDSGFTNAVECDDVKPDGCDTVRKTLHFVDEQPFHTHWKYKYVVDLDGMSYSARFIAFLKSESTPIKATIYREFYSDWIQPWLHYIPLSSDYHELYSLYAYFSGGTASMLDSIGSPNSLTNWLRDISITSPRGAPVDGDNQLRAIGHAGREWKLANARIADMEVYVYRLLLEYARLWFDDRDAMSHKDPEGTRSGIVS